LEEIENGRFHLKDNMEGVKHRKESLVEVSHLEEAKIDLDRTIAEVEANNEGEVGAAKLKIMKKFKIAILAKQDNYKRPIELAV
jgi:hypothetical protein